MTAIFVLFLFTALFGVCTISSWRQYHEARLDARGRDELHAALRSYLSMFCNGPEDWKAIEDHARACEPKFRTALGKGSTPAKFYLEALYVAKVVEDHVDEPASRTAPPRARAREWYRMSDLERMARLDDGDACLALSVERMLGLTAPGRFEEALPWAKRALESDAPGAEAWWENITAVECGRQQERLLVRFVQYMNDNGLTDSAAAVESLGGPERWQDELFGGTDGGPVPACPAGGALRLAGEGGGRRCPEPVVCSFAAKHVRHYFPRTPGAIRTYFGPVEADGERSGNRGEGE